MTTSNHTEHHPLPAGWQHGPLVRHLRGLTVERRQSLLAGSFALAAAVWAPLGVLAFLGHWMGVWAIVTALVVAVLVAPVPSDLDGLVRPLVETLEVARRRVAALAGRAAEAVAEAAQSIPRSTR